MSRNGLKLLLGLILMAGVATPTLAQKKLYRWVDKQGKVHYDDALPPEAVEQARQEFNPLSGRTTKMVDRALTPEERAQKAAEQAAAAAAAQLSEEQKKQESVMLSSYDTEADLIRAYNERINLLQMTIESTEVSIKSMRNSLARMLADASETELENRKVIDVRIATINSVHAEQTKQIAFQVSRHTELKNLRAEFDRMLSRYRELRGTASAESPTAALPAPSKP